MNCYEVCSSLAKVYFAAQECLDKDDFCSSMEDFNGFIIAVKHLKENFNNFIQLYEDYMLDLEAKEFDNWERIQSEIEKEYYLEGVDYEC